MRATGRGEHPLVPVLRRQCQVLTRSQLVAGGYTAKFARSRVDSGRWQRLHPGVYVTHSGPVDWTTRAWGAVLAAGPGAALSLTSAGYLHRLVRRSPSVLDVTVPHARHVVVPAGARMHRTRRPFTIDGSPPRTSLWTTAIDLAGQAGGADDVVGILTEAVRRGCVPGLLRQESAARGRLRHRQLIDDMLLVVADGVESPLEHRYLRDVERAHGLPRSRRQTWALVDGQWIRADAVYDKYRLRVELDGNLGHPGGSTDDDVWRDNAVMVGRREVTLRYRWSHVVVRTCAAAAQVGEGLRGGGWRGTPRRCGPTCRL